MRRAPHKDLVLRLGKDGAAAALEEPQTRPMDFTGKTIKTMVYVSAAGFEHDGGLRAWIKRAVDFTKTLPAK